MTSQDLQAEEAVTPGQEDAPRRRGRATLAAWPVFAVIAAVVLGMTVTQDFRDEPLAGDTSAHLMQALSLAYDSHSFNFDGRDLANWKELGWAAEPVGMFFQRYDGDRYGVAKPYGYSLFLAPFIGVLGPVRGVAVANATLLAALMLISFLLLRTRFRGPVVPLTVGALFLASYAYMYAFWIHTELFLALVVLLAFFGAVRFAQTQQALWGLFSFAVMGFAVSEKAAFVALFGPIALVMLIKAPRMWLRVAMPAAALLVFAVAVLPYLRYSDWKSFTPYAGEDRLYVRSATPFAGGTEGFSSTTFSEGGIIDEIDASLDDKLTSLAYYLVGRHTGMLVYMPLALLLIGAGIARLKGADAWGRAAVLSVLCYLAFYAFLFPGNYFGGGQSLGNRYFLQIAPAVLAIPVLAGIRSRVLLGSSLAAVLIGVVLLWPFHRDPPEAHVFIERTSAIQRLLPFESNQDTAAYYRCRKQIITQITVCL